MAVRVVSCVLPCWLVLLLLSTCQSRPLPDSSAVVAKKTGGAVEAGEPPLFCHGLDCPRYNVTARNKEYELRAYEASQWSVVHVSGMDFDAAVKAGFMSLFKYIQGANAEAQKIPMAAPVAVKVVPGPGPDCATDFFVAFFLPFAFWDKAPPATDNTITTYKAPAFSAAVSTYPGFNDKQTMLKQAEKLGVALEAAGVKVPDSFFYLGYDSPFRVIGRHNEIAMMIAGDAGLGGLPV